MDLHSGGTGNGNTGSTGSGGNNGNSEGGRPDAEQSSEPGFEEKGPITTINSGAALARIDHTRGGRLIEWQWRYTPPIEAIQPHTSRSPRLLELVNPEYGALIDHFIPLGSRPAEFQSGEQREFGDFVEGEYRRQTVDTGGEIRIGLLRDGKIQAGQRVAEVRMAKSAALRPGGPDISVLYRVINSSLRPLQILFAVEFNLFAPGLSSTSVSAGQAGYYLIDGDRPDDSAFGSMGVSPGATHVALANPGGEMALQMGWDRECDLWRLPAPGGGSGVRLFAVWRLQLPPRDNWAMGLWLAPG